MDIKGQSNIEGDDAQKLEKFILMGSIAGAGGSGDPLEQEEEEEKEQEQEQQQEQEQEQEQEEQSEILKKPSAANDEDNTSQKSKKVKTPEQARQANLMNTLMQSEKVGIEASKILDKLKASKLDKARAASMQKDMDHVEQLQQECKKTWIKMNGISKIEGFANKFEKAMASLSAAVKVAKKIC